MLTLILITDLLGLLVGGLWLWRTGPRGGPRELADLLGLGVALAAAALVATQVTLGDRFALVRILCHVLFCVWAPLSLARGVTLLVRRRSPVLALGLIVLSLGMEGVYLYSRHVEPYRLQIARHRIVSPRLLGLREPVRIAVLADLQTDTIGAYERDVFRRLDEERADLILLLGDYLQVEGADFPQQQRLLAGLFAGLRHTPRYGIFALDGDTDWAGVSLRGTAARPLVDEQVTLPTDPPIRLWGLSTDSSRPDLTADRLAEIAAFPGYPIVLGHAPDYMQPILTGRADPGGLFLAGHCHGGQVVVPGFGPPVTLSRISRRYAGGGLFAFGETRVCISRGIGMERGNAPRIRFLCPPELVVIELHPPVEMAAGNAGRRD